MKTDLLIAIGIQLAIYAYFRWVDAIVVTDTRDWSSVITKMWPLAIGTALGIVGIWWTCRQMYIESQSIWQVRIVTRLLSYIVGIGVTYLATRQVPSIRQVGGLVLMVVATIVAAG